MMMRCFFSDGCVCIVVNLLGSIKLFARWVYKNTNARDDIVDDAMCRGFMGCHDSFVTTLTIPNEYFGRMNKR
jgi:hypothetical protein